MDAGQWSANPWPPPGLTGLELVQSHNSFISLSLSASVFHPLLSIPQRKCYLVTERTSDFFSVVWHVLNWIFCFLFSKAPHSLCIALFLLLECNPSFCPRAPFSLLAPSLLHGCVCVCMCVTSTWKTRSTPKHFFDAWSVLIIYSNCLQCYDGVSDKTPGSFSAASEQNTLSFLICCYGNGHWLGWCNAKWSW